MNPSHPPPIRLLNELMQIITHHPVYRRMPLNSQFPRANKQVVFDNQSEIPFPAFELHIISEARVMWTLCNNARRKVIDWREMKAVTG
jgi:hypothetical protein